MSAYESQLTPPVSKAALWTGRVISGLVTVFLLVDGTIKLVPIQPVIDTSRELQIPIDLARPLGLITLVCTILYAIPPTSIVGAILLTGYMGGAIYTHLRVDSPLFTHTLFGVYLALLIWGGLYLREPRVRALIPFRT